MNPEIWMLKAEIERDHARALRLLTDAYRLAEKQGAVANALRAAAMIIVRRRSTPDDTEWARATLDLLDARRHPDPERPHWMMEDLARASRVVKSLDSTSHGV